MSHIGILTSKSFPLREFNTALGAGLTITKTQSIDSIAVLADGCPAGLVPAWAKDRFVTEIGVTPAAVYTQGFDSASLALRNETLMPPDGKNVMFVFGPVASRSMSMVLGRAFATPSLHVAQIIEGVATIVGRLTVVCLPGFEVEEPKPLSAGAAHMSGTNPLAKWAKKPTPAGSKSKKS